MPLFIQKIHVFETDYSNIDDELDSQLPWLKNKAELDSEDLECIKTANKIESLYKKICQSSIESTLPHKVNSYTPILVPGMKEVFTKSRFLHFKIFLILLILNFKANFNKS